jgi:hypothetical protein
MFRKLVKLALPGALFLIGMGVAGAQTSKPTVEGLNNCVNSFYDPKSYNWLAFQNTCNAAINVRFVFNDASAATGSMDLGPGRHSSTGRSAKEITDHGGMSYYACPQGYIATDPNGNFIESRVDGYVCRQQ